ncbi:MAG: DUF692 family protein [Leptolinea sp.]|jgi:uncharacterized protein (UPF0276 family)|nr:DUF692 family protein [Leptolinea sp.]
MKLAVNFSRPAADLLQSGQINFDLFKTIDGPEMVSEASEILPVYVHFGLYCGNGHGANFDWPVIEEYLARTKTDFVNLHIVAPPELDPCDQSQVEKTLDRIVEEVRTVCDHFGADRVITENIPLPLNGKKYLRPVALPTFFQRLAAETGCGMLLDLAHAAITAKTLQTDPRSFFSEFPIRRLREIHVTGLGMHEGEIHDHMEMIDRDWNLFEYAIDRIKMGEWHAPDIVAFEYGGTGTPYLWRSEPRVLLEQVPRLKEMIYQHDNSRHTSG